MESPLLQEPPELGEGPDLQPRLDRREGPDLATLAEDIDASLEVEELDISQLSSSDLIPLRDAEELVDLADEVAEPMAPMPAPESEPRARCSSAPPA